MDTAQQLASLRSLIERFVHDVLASAGLEATAEITQDEEFWDACLWLQGGGTGFRVLKRLLDEERGEEILTQLADDWSEPVMEAVLAVAGVEQARLWPKCPHHSHALNPKLRGGQACWCCDLDKTVAFRVGTLPLLG